jgi:inner membrane protein
LWFSLYHSRHTLAFGFVIAAIAFVLAKQKWKVGFFALVSFHLHLIEDLAGSRGPDRYQWPIPYLKPFSSALQLTWQGQWGLNAWQNVVITAILLLVTFWLAWWQGFSPLEMISAKADAAFVETLRRRFPGHPEAA